MKKFIRKSYYKDDDYYNKRYEIRLQKIAPFFDEFQEYVEKEIQNVLSKSPVGKALDYTKKLLSDMKTLLLDS